MRKIKDTTIVRLNIISLTAKDACTILYRKLTFIEGTYKLDTTVPNRIASVNNLLERIIK